MATFDPHPTLRDLIDAHEAADRARPAGRPIRVIRALVMTAAGAAMTCARRPTG
jgi:hypothetical protein